jgi:transcription elongation factor GreA
MTEPITVNGAQKLQDELNDLINNKRQKVIQAIAEAREHGDLKENAEYHAAKEEQGHIESRIQEIQLLLSNAEIIDITKVEQKNKTVVFGATIELSDLDNETKTKFKIVGNDEADIENGLISYKSPVASALIGKEKGDFVSVSTPKGEKNYEVVKVVYK